MAGHFVPIYPFGQFCQSYPPACNWCYNVIWPSKPGYRHLICGDICNIGQTMIQNIIFGNGGTFYPVYPFRIILTKVLPSRFVAEMFIFVLVPINLPNYEWSSTRFYFKPFLEIIPQTITAQLHIMGNTVSARQIHISTMCVVLICVVLIVLI